MRCEINSQKNHQPLEKCFIKIFFAQLLCLFFFIQVEVGDAETGDGPLSPLVQDAASGSSSDASFASVLGNTCPCSAAPPHSAFTVSTLPGDDKRVLGSRNDMLLTRPESEIT